MRAVTGIAGSRRGVLVFFTLALLVYMAAMYVRLGVELADDGAFFLRYAENMAKGEFWVWNLGEAPVWGASAPLFPVLLAIPIALGFPSVPSLIVISIGLGSLALAGVATLLLLQFGFVAGFTFLVMTALDTGIMYFSGSGLESPLTFALLALGVAGLLCPRMTWTLGLAAGLLMVNKLDLVPAGGLLLLAVWLRDRRFPLRATVIAGGIAATWYGFAWVYFGYPVPNSFLTKSLHQNDFPTSMTWKWFSDYIFLTGIHLPMAVFAVLALFWRRNLPLAVFLLGTVAVHTVAYTLKYPFEPYNWYGMPALFGLFTLGAIGFAGVTGLATAFVPAKLSWVRVALPATLVCTYAGLMMRGEIIGTQAIKWFAANHEFDRSEAGRWVNANTPKDFTVYTMWGNPAYYSQRKVIDGSFLNRRFEEGNVVLKYLPEIMIMQNQSGTTPASPQVAWQSGRYRAVKVFDRTYFNHIDYFFIVLARDDVADRVENKEIRLNLLKFVSKLNLGDYNGLLKDTRDESVLFVHPGRTTATTFEFDAKSFLQGSGRDSMRVEAAMDPNISAEAVKRGGGTAHIVVSAGGKELGQAVVRPGQPFTLQVPAAAGDNVNFSVDANGVPDTNWLLLTIK
ncbi:hypothetical protein [Ancylobacter polymorphus]|uniref:Glycosyltransferase RgtA/B/C/D-like domain-containing protein n=1 Tax=Ancylobacter polymorphus TaxID=223390 RepID=A0ABU0B9A8_9HYPH|nr:hypothetical protein [Ancylobacter polymorphus]MDQ0301612.1 hypothetical protein [Ancylobacter polymorphus]